MKRVLICVGTAWLLSACGYHIGGMKNRALANMHTYSIGMFANHSVYPNVAMQMTTALSDQLQRDGTFRIASADTCDFRIDGVVNSVNASSLRTNWRNTYLSTEIGLTVEVTYKVTDRKTGKVLMTRSTRAEGSYFNDTGNVQTSRDSALSYATRRAAENITQTLTAP